MNTSQSSELLKSYAVNELLRKYNMARIRDKSGDNTQVEVPLKITKSKGALWVLVILPIDYPAMKPIFQIINAKVSHEFIDDDYKIVHPSLDDWNKNSSLCETLAKIHEEFESDPPKLRKSSQESHKVKEKFRTAIMLKKPELKDFEEKVKELSNDELDLILNDEMLLSNFEPHNKERNSDSLFGVYTNLGKITIYFLVNIFKIFWYLQYSIFWFRFMSIV